MVLPTPQSRDRGPLITSYPSWGHQSGTGVVSASLASNTGPRNILIHAPVNSTAGSDHSDGVMSIICYSPFAHVFAYSQPLLRTTPPQHCDRPGDRQVGGSAPPSGWSRPPDGTLHITLRPVGRRKAQRPCGELSADTANAPGEVPRTLPARPPRK